MKQSIVYVMDASPSMAKSFPDPASSSSHNTRFSVSKAFIQSHLTELMLQSKTNEASVIVAGTERTNHRLCHSLDSEDQQQQQEDTNVLYPHVTELCALHRLSTSLLRKIEGVCVTKEEAQLEMEGSVVNAIILAAAALYDRTQGKKYLRRILVFTDAERKVNIHFHDLEEAIYRICDMQCEVIIVGFDFVHSTEDLKVKLENMGEKMDHLDNNIVKHLQDDKDDLLSELDRVKSDNQKFLISLVANTGGEVYSFHDSQQLFRHPFGKLLRQSALKKLEFLIAPGIVVQGRLSFVNAKVHIPSMRREAVMVEPDGKTPLLNSLGEEMVVPVRNVTTHFDDTNEDWNEVPLIQRVDAYAYGSDLIPISDIDLQGTKLRSPPRITILGYVPVESIPLYSLIGPVRLLSGEESSERACVAISSLAQAMFRLNQVAICTLVTMKDADPLMGVLYPEMSQEKADSEPKPRRLHYLQLPFADDIQKMTMRPFHNSIGSENEREACMDFINHFTLADDVLSCKTTTNPALRSFREMLLYRALHKKMEKNERTRKYTMSTLESMAISREQQLVLEKLRALFPLTNTETDQKKKSTKLYFDGLEHETDCEDT